MLECFFCQNVGGQLLYRNELYRIVLVNEAAYPAYLRLVLNRHAKELSDLSTKEYQEIFFGLLNSEKVLRKLINPDKINLASFGNMTPHVHWHIIPRFKDDRHFPNPNWGEVTHPEYQPSAELSLAAKNLASQFESLFLA